MEMRSRSELYKYKEHLQYRLKTAKSLLDDRKYKYILDFIKRLKAEGLSDARITKYVHVLTMYGLKRDPYNPTYEDVLDFLYELENSDFTRSTKETYKWIVKAWLRREGYEDIANKIKASNTGTTITKSDLLTQEDIYKMLNVCGTMYQAIIILLYELGCRITEILSLRIKDIELHATYGFVTIPVSKTVTRTIPIFLSVPYLRRWLENHPNPDPDSYVWLNQYRRGPLSYDSFRVHIKRIMKKAGVKAKRIPYIFRHSRATELCPVMPQHAFKKYFGWGPNSRMPNRYVHLSMEDVHDQLFQMYGFKKKKEIYRRCLRCGTVNLAAAKHCSSCGTALDAKQVAKEMEIIMHSKTLTEELENLKQQVAKLMKDQGNEK